MLTSVSSHRDGSNYTLNVTSGTHTTPITCHTYMNRSHRTLLILVGWLIGV